MADFDIQGKITYDATQATSALKGVSQAAGDTATATTKVGEASAKAQVNVGQFGSSIGLAGQAVSKLSPQVGGLVTMVGSATGAMQSLMTAGLGPVGLAIGAVSIALSAATALWNSQQEAIKRNEDALREYDKIQSEIAARNRERAQDREMEQLDEEYRNSEAGRRARAQANWESNYEFNRRADLQRMALLAEELDAEEQQRQERRQRRAGGGARRPTLEQLMAQAGGGGALALEGLNMETLGRDPEAMAIANADKGADIEQQRYLEQLDRNRAYLEAREAQEKEAADRLQAINDSVFQALESAFASSVNAWLDGSMSMGEAALDMVKNVAKSLASEAIVQGLKQTALGLSALAVGSPTAVGHFAAAGKWAAVGVAAGVVGAASGAFGGGGGGGGAGPAAATGGPALTAGAREGAGTTVVINWGSSGLVYAADRAQLGRDISGMISEAHGRLGRGM
jgi:hypothetical protein